MAPVALSPQPLQPQLSSPPIKPTLKRPRSSEPVSSSPLSKRARVTFSPRTDYKANQIAKQKELSQIREEVTYAIRHPQDSEEYAHIKSYFTAQPNAEDALGDASLREYLVVLINNAPILNKRTHDLVIAILKHQWLARDEQFVGLYTAFLGHLVSSQGSHLTQVLRMLVDNYAHLSTSAGLGQPSDGATRQTLRERIHKAMKYVLRIVPSASSTMMSLIRSAFPYADESRKAHVQYVRNLLRLVEYCPEVKADVYDLLTDRLLKLDVEVQVDVDELDEDIGELLADNDTLAHRHELDPYEDDEDLPSDDDLDDISMDEDKQHLKVLTSTVEKMDALMDILFTSHDANLRSSAKLIRSSTFDLLLSQFHKTFLKTYRSRHTQFLIFHFAQTTPEYTDRFINTCLDVLRSHGDAIQRVSAAAYLASFVARGARISRDAIHNAFMSLSAYADMLRKQHEPTSRGPDRRRYEIYYATVQALIYIFCFRWRELRFQAGADGDCLDEAAEGDEDEDDLLAPSSRNWPPHIKDALTLNLYSTLNPLKVCAPEVVEEFARLAHRLGFLYVYPLINANRRIRLQGPARTASSSSISVVETSLDQLRGDRQWQLDAYFPFDPYNLPVSKRWLEGDYNHWVDVDEVGNGAAQANAGQAELDSSDDGDDSAEEEDDDDDDDDDEEEVATATPGSEH